MDLPPAGWRALGTARKPKGFAFRAGSAAAPIGAVIVKTNALSVKGGGSGWTYTLDEPQQGRVAVRLRLGDVAWCADAAARTGGKPPSSTRFDRVGRFDGRPSAPPPPVCPIYDTPFGG